MVPPVSWPSLVAVVLHDLPLGETERYGETERGGIFLLTITIYLRT